MCKFNNKLFVFIIQCLILFNIISCRPASIKKSLINFIDEYTDDYYDIHFDQRQNGTENIRINLEGFLVVIPSETENSPDSPTYTDELMNLLDSLELRPSSDSESSTFNGSDDDENTEAIKNKNDKEKLQSVQIINPSEELMKNDHNGSTVILEGFNNVADSQKIQKSSSDYNLEKMAKNNKKYKSKFRFMNLLKMFRRVRKDN